MALIEACALILNDTNTMFILLFKLKNSGTAVSINKIHLKKNQLDAQFIFNIFGQTPLHVSGVSIAHHQEVHHMDTFGTYYSF